MVLVLVVGDLHVPQRAAAIPEAFTHMLTPGRIKVVLITGNVGCREMHNYFRTIAPEVYCAKGEFDRWSYPQLKETHLITVEDLKIGLIHGHQVVPCGDRDSLAMLQRKMDVDILVSGATHHCKTFEFDGHLFVNPGSITGAFTPAQPDVAPAFVLLDIKGKTVTSFAYVYKPRGGISGEDFTIKRKVWTKE
ncbi:vacuolar sorting protein [Trypanosoma rangeli]|uniref:Vacuolar protein sorting-associated protein 29 n=1 Tax=Trypanosoma rangeli TaxID=5698 RepID=A0A422P1G5_TRYRA|nr:vacuolar sorting protein [Trypanosoma rangeli]RNF11541.1 vacuolar sorting protein [Trypanosoma rangeli]|eukprot:RNF11541.1 vacuolar sorting protein [Trypanosoma rangeli]